MITVLQAELLWTVGDPSSLQHRFCPGNSSLKSKGKAGDGERCQQQNSTRVFYAKGIYTNILLPFTELLTLLYFPVSNGEEKEKYTMGKSKDENRHENRTVCVFKI